VSGSSSARRPAVREAPEVAAILRQEREAEFASLPDSAKAALQARKWQAIRDYLARHPFQVSETLPRAEQWQRVVRYLRSILPEPDLVAWAATQGEVEANLAKGVRDLRPRECRPCYLGVLRYVDGRLNKAAAILRWELAANEEAEASPGGR
jgi:hypothetical protein